ncbi:MAG: Hsp33 family molecular chaperone HslO [Clostridia bacterium]|nr:Hsp33 family molecular chaperone HslO [Clostridia bacterium]MDD7672270.1 Hsp33 family molecular chaperone HslO [Clostridia bacterium]
MKQDFLVRGMTGDGFVRIAAVQTTNMVERMRQIHKTLPLATAALGRTLTAASMMGSELKDANGSVTLQIRGNGPLGAITAVSDSRGYVRGYLQNPAANLPLRADGHLDVGGGVGREGILTVIKDIGEGEPFSGKIELYSGEIAEDIAAYYLLSEQIPTVCALGVLVDRDQTVRCAGGYLLQLLPGAPEGLIDLLEYRVADVGSVTACLDKGMDMRQVAQELLYGMDLKLMEEQPVGYECKCSRSKVASALVSLGRDELDRLIREEEKIDVTCQFCDKIYTFTRKDLETLRNG